MSEGITLTKLKERNPFGEVAQSQNGNALSQTDQSRAIAEVQAALMVAKGSPRNQIQAMDRILNACTRPRLAEQAVYSYGRGGSSISGPSIRLAETVAINWGNIQFGVREISQQNKESTVQAYAWDLETNTRREMVFQVPHFRHTKNGKYELTDPRDIYELVANNGARRLRACILSVIPGDVIEAAVSQCELTMHAQADLSPEGIKKILLAFESYGVSKEQIEKRIQRRIDAIQPAQVAALKKVYASLKDGMSEVADWFEPIATLSVAETKAKMVKQKDQTKPEAQLANTEEPKQNELTPEEIAKILEKESKEANNE